MKPLRLNGVVRHLDGLYDSDMYFSGLSDEPEPHLVDICNRVMRKDSICWDIGANIGVTSHIIAAAAPFGIVAAVEGGADVFNVLQKNIIENKLENVIKPIHAVAGERYGSIRFAENSAYGSINFDGKITKMVSPETLLRQYTDGRVDFIKIDIEGFEPAFMKAAHDIICENGAVVFMEFNAWCLLVNSRENPVNFMEWIGQNYKGIYLTGMSSVTKLRRFGPNQLMELLHIIIIESQCIRDLVLTNNDAMMQLLEV